MVNTSRPTYFGNNIEGYVSKEDIITKFTVNGREELENLIREKKDAGESPDIEMSCHFCDKKYTFETSEIEKLMESATK